MRQRGHQTLIDIQRRQLVKFLEQIGALRHYLRQQRNRLGRTLPDESAELCSAQKHGRRFFRCARVRNVMTVRRKPFASKCLSGRSNQRNESTSYFYLVAQNDVTLEYDEDAVRGSATLIELKSGRPVSFRAACAARRYPAPSAT